MMGKQHNASSHTRVDNSVHQGSTTAGWDTHGKLATVRAKTTLAKIKR